MIALEDVRKSFDGRVILEPTTLAVPAKEALALVGPSGCGKSTLLRLLVGLLLPDAGTVRMDGVVLTPRTMTAVRRRVGYVIQDGGLFPHLTARANATLLACELGWSSQQANVRLERVAEFVRADRQLFERYPAQLSGGEKQRFALIRALMLDPPILLLDEPMGALDPLARFALRADLKRIFRELGKTVLLVTHDLSEAAELGDEIALMASGRIVQRGTMAELRAAPADEFVRDFVHARAAGA